MLEYYVNWYSDHEQLPYRHFDVAAQNLLRNYPWSGDITQLKQFVKGILSNGDSERIELREIEQTLHLITATAEAEAGNQMQISIDLGLDFEASADRAGGGQERTHLYRKLKSLGLHSKKK